MYIDLYYCLSDCCLYIAANASIELTLSISQTAKTALQIRFFLN